MRRISVLSKGNLKESGHWDGSSLEYFAYRKIFPGNARNVLRALQI